MLVRVPRCQGPDLRLRVQDVEEVDVCRLMGIGFDAETRMGHCEIL